MKVLSILNEAPYGSERLYDAMRLAMALQKDGHGTEIRVFLMADAVTAALPAHGTPQGYYSIERMLKAVIAKGGQLGLCGTCCAARGIEALPLVEGGEMSTMSRLARWTVELDRVLDLLACVPDPRFRREPWSHTARPGFRGSQRSLDACRARLWRIRSRPGASPRTLGSPAPRA